VQKQFCNADNGILFDVNEFKDVVNGVSADVEDIVFDVELFCDNVTVYFFCGKQLYFNVDDIKGNVNGI
jgi:hypothetical protein